MNGYVGNSNDSQKIARLNKSRDEERKAYEETQRKREAAMGKSGLLQFGSSLAETAETAFKAETVGLVTREQFVEKRANIEKELAEAAANRQLAAEEAELKARAAGRAQKRGPGALLSFADDEEKEEGEDGEEGDEDEGKAGGGGGAGGEAPEGPAGAANKKLRFGGVGKNPAVDTSFLPDRDRERQERLEREALRATYLQQLEAEKAEPLQITYSFWDGKGHRRTINVKKGDTIGQFLGAVKAQLAPEFREIRITGVDGLLYIKEDLIIPHHYSFHELISTKARGKSGPLFHFDVHEDIRMKADARVEKDESHAGKVIERRWYDKNKHIFPASRWETYDPAKTYGDGYTIFG